MHKKDFWVKNEEKSYTYFLYFQVEYFIFKSTTFEH